jgi:type II secretory pathway component PulF
MPSTIDTFNSFSNLNNSLNKLMSLIQFFIGIQWGFILIVIFISITHNHKKLTINYLKLFKLNQKNIFVYFISYSYLFDLVYLMNLNLNLENQMNILKQIDFPMYKVISDTVVSNLIKGNSIKNAFNYLDPLFLKILMIEDYDRKMEDRITNYLNVLKKRIEISIKKYANLFTTFVYIQIAIMVLIVYSILLYPLKLLEGMNL